MKTAAVVLVLSSTLAVAERPSYPLYPDAKINEPFDLMDNIDHIEVQAAGVRVAMKK